MSNVAEECFGGVARRIMSPALIFTNEWGELLKQQRIFWRVTAGGMKWENDLLFFYIMQILYLMTSGYHRHLQTYPLCLCLSFLVSILPSFPNGSDTLLATQTLSAMRLHTPIDPWACGHYSKPQFAWLGCWDATVVSNPSLGNRLILPEPWSQLRSSKGERSLPPPFSLPLSSLSPPPQPLYHQTSSLCLVWASPSWQRRFKWLLVILVW